VTLAGGRRPRRGRPRQAGGPRRGEAAPTKARLLAYRVLSRVEGTGAFADLALRGALGRCGLGPSDRALVTELVYGTLRWRGRLDHLLRAVLDHELEGLEPRVATLLRLGAYQIVFADRIPKSAAVDQTVRCARATGADRAAGLVNAVLRRLAGCAGEIPLPRLEEDPAGHLVHALSMPPWVAERLLARFGADEAAQLAEASNAVPPLTLRTSLHRGSRDALLAELRARFPSAEPCRFAPLGIRLAHGGDPGRDPGFLEGRFTLQDEASQLVVELLAPRPGERVLDACAAPGTKATAVAERVGGAGRVLAVDRNPARLKLVGRDARRLGLGNLGTAEADLTRPLPAVVPRDGFDRVLVDAPCSGLGTLRRNPDLRWRLGPEDPARLASTQRAILAHAALALRPGGVLVYSTCTFLPEENESVVDDFLTDAPDFRRAPPPELPEGLRALLDEAGDLRTLPHRHDADGFYAARLERRA
jgi:16S rRNA (cytosine967-C5)-methyltransferase